jgi:hypothetical protein
VHHVTSPENPPPGTIMCRFKVRLTELNGITLGGSPFEFGRLIAYETGRWGNVIRAANIKPE